MKLSKLKETIKNDKKLAVLLVIGVIGIMLLAISEIEAKPENDESGKADIKTVTQETYEKELEKRLEKIVASVDGAGRAQVMITLKSSEENKYAVNSSSENQISDGKSNSKSSNDYVVIDSSSGDSCVVLRTESPKIQGVIVVCDGGDNSKVKNDVTNAVSALLGINVNHISVLKMKNSEG